MFVVEQVCAGAGEHNPPGFQDIGPVGDPERLVDVLLHEQNGDPLPVDLGDDVEDVLDEERRQSQ